MHWQIINTCIAATHLFHILNIWCYHVSVIIWWDCFVFQHDFIVKNAQFIVDIMMKKIETHYKSKGLAFPKDLEAISGEFRKVKWQWFIPSYSHSTWGSVDELLITQLCHTGNIIFDFCWMCNSICLWIKYYHLSAYRINRNYMTQLV